MTKSALKRHHTARLKNKRKSYYTVHTGNVELDKIRVAKAIKTPKRCSCPLCGNARRHFSRDTLKEVSDALYYKLELLDLGL